MSKAQHAKPQPEPEPIERRRPDDPPFIACPSCTDRNGGTPRNHKVAWEFWLEPLPEETDGSADGRPALPPH